VVGWEKGQTNSILGAGAREYSPKQFESTGSQVLAKICFTQPLTKTVSKYVTGNYGYSIYNNLKFAFEAAKNIRFSHSNLFWGASLAPILFYFILFYKFAII
jgi:hypothetical protein